MDDAVGVADMVLLDPLSEDELVKNLCKRFREERIYTYIGNVVVSVNPYKSVNIYNKDYIEDYRSRNIYELPPHIFALTDNAYRSMRNFNRDQCIIISGESGSGKTEASKIVMRYVAAVSGKGHEVDRVKEQLLQSNPVLEAFGNAKTIRNDNSSRFGKYMDLEFDFKGDPLGGVISNYLLEKSRVVTQAKGERNFHMFYQLLLGGSDKLLESLNLERDFSHYSYLSQSGCTSVPSIDDAKNYKMVEAAMKNIGFKAEEISGIFQLLGAILHLGNVQFKELFKLGMDTVEVFNEEDAFQAAALFGCKPQRILDALCTRTVGTGVSQVVTRLSPANANYGRDALSKAVYNRLFNWIVSKINDSIRVSKKYFGKKVIGVLDIYGFEVFGNNSFEQFVINYCNEKLQQLFIELTLKQEQEEYIRERIEWIHIDYFNNAVICDLIEKPNVGIMALLDEECLRPGDVTDMTFLDKLNDRCLEHPHFESRVKVRSDTSLQFDCFKLKHFAGDVTYDVNNFIDKNNDPLYQDMSKAMYSCDHVLLKKMFPEGNPEVKNLKRPPTVSTQMKVSVAELVKNLMSKQPHYIRCIKPNEIKSSTHFDDRIVRHEARYLGLLENIRVRRAGYCYRQEYATVLHRYKMLSTSTWPNWDGEAKDGVQTIMEILKIKSPECEYGKTKLFIRDPRTILDIEERRKTRILDLVVLIQKIVRGWVAKHKYERMRYSQIKVASYYRMYRQKKKYLHFRNTVIYIQAFLRGCRARKIYSKKLKKFAAPKIIRFIKRALAVKFVLDMYNNVPSQSPLDEAWPPCSKMFREPSDQLCQIYHGWRCHKYRKHLAPERKQILTEKLQASELFKDKKSSYPHSVAVPFSGDHAEISTHPAWDKQKVKLPEIKIIFAENVSKIHRSNAKEVPRTLILSHTELFLLNPKNLNLLYRIELNDIESVTTSPYKDGTVVFHVKSDKKNKTLSKGDFMFHSDHVIELVAKVTLTLKKHLQKELIVNIAESFSANFKGKSIELAMQPDVNIARASFKRKGSRMNIDV